MHRPELQGGRVLENPSPLGEGDFSLEKSGEGLNAQKSPLPILINQNLPLPQAREGAFFIELDCPAKMDYTGDFCVEHTWFYLNCRRHHVAHGPRRDAASVICTEDAQESSLISCFG